MLRSLLIYLSKAAWAKRLVTSWGFARRTALRFVAGETLPQALEVVKQLNAASMHATLDHLGEDTHSPDEARQSTQEIIALLNAVDQAGIPSGISIKLTQIGLSLDETLCAQNLAQILAHARSLGIYVRIDMEDSPWVDATLRLASQMRDQHGFDHFGLVIQSYLYRSEEDTRLLLQQALTIRLVKGAYMEPAEIAYPKKKDVDAAFDRLTAMLLDASLLDSAPALSADGKTPPIPAIATHDEQRVAFAKDYAAQIGLPKDKLEFQMLYGIRRDLQERLVAEGYPVRVYIPYGSQWYPYFMRRLAERPANLWFFLSSLLKR